MPKTHTLSSRGTPYKNYTNDINEANENHTNDIDKAKEELQKLKNALEMFDYSEFPDRNNPSNLTGEKFKKNSDNGGKEPPFLEQLNTSVKGANLHQNTFENGLPEKSQISNLRIKISDTNILLPKRIDDQCIEKTRRSGYVDPKLVSSKECTGFRHKTEGGEISK
jgi:hypothetical protein